MTRTTRVGCVLGVRKNKIDKNEKGGKTTLNIYEIDKAMTDLIDPDTGELMDYEAFSQLQMERDAKIENMACWYKNLMAEAEALKNEADRLTERRKAVENKAERLKAYIAQVLNGEKFKTAKCYISYRPSTAVEVTDSDIAADWLSRNGHDDCLRYKAPEIAKKELMALLNSGVEVPGCQKVEKNNIGVK